MRWGDAKPLLKKMLLEDKVPDDEPIVLKFPRKEARKRVKNEEGRTRLIKQLDTPETYSEFNAQFARYIEHSGGNPQIAYSIMLRLLAQLSNESIKKLAEDEDKPGAAAIPKAQIPSDEDTGSQSLGDA